MRSSPGQRLCGLPPPSRTAPGLVVTAAAVASRPRMGWRAAPPPPSLPSPLLLPLPTLLKAAVSGPALPLPCMRLPSRRPPVVLAWCWRLL